MQVKQSVLEKEAPRYSKLQALFFDYAKMAVIVFVHLSVSNDNKVASPSGIVFQVNYKNGVNTISLTHWGRVTHICVGTNINIGSDNGLSPGRRQAIIWTNAGMLLIGPLGTNFSEILIEILTFSFKKMHLKMSSAKWRLFCLGLNVLSTQPPISNLNNWSNS